MKPNTKTQVIMDYASQLKLSGIHDRLEEIQWKTKYTYLYIRNKSERLI
jgi:hypothetical protein